GFHRERSGRSLWRHSNLQRPLSNQLHHPITIMNRLIKCFTFSVLLLLWATSAVFALDTPTIYILDIKGNPILHAYVNVGDQAVIPVDEKGACQLPDSLDRDETLVIVAMGYDIKQLPVREAMENPSIILEEKIGKLGEIVVSATRTNRSV